MLVFLSIFYIYSKIITKGRKKCKQSNIQYNSILYSAFHNTHRFKAALQKMQESTIQFREICYQRRLSSISQNTCTNHTVRW